jgi:hypothetical protein
MPQERVPCPRCNPQAAGFSWSRNPIGICPNCSGRRFVNAYRLFDPRKPASALQRILQTLVVVAFVVLCASYVSRITQKVDTLRQERQAVLPIPSGVTSGGAFLPLVDTDLPAQCVGQSSTEACMSAVQEFHAGYGAIKCGYKVDQTGKMRYYFFWFQKVPSHLVALAKNDPKASLRALGSTAVQECPTTLEAAEALYRENSR